MLLKIGNQKKLLSERVEIFMKVWNQLRMEISNNGKLLEGCVICNMFYPKCLQCIQCLSLHVSCHLNTVMIITKLAVINS